MRKSLRWRSSPCVALGAGIVLADLSGGLVIDPLTLLLGIRRGTTIPGLGVLHDR